MPADESSERAQWTDTRWVPDAIVVSLGTNDWSLQAKEPLSEEEFTGAYVSFVHDLLMRFPTAIVFLTQGAIVKDAQLKEFIRETVRRVADTRVRWIESRHYPGADCDAHPTRPQHRQIADDLEPVLRSALGW